MKYVVTLYKKYSISATSQNEAIKIAQETLKEESLLVENPLYIICKKVVIK